MASIAGSAIAGLFSGQPLTDKSSVQQLEDANPDLDTVQEMKGGAHQQPVHSGKTSEAICVDLVLWRRKEEFRSWREARYAKRQLDPSKAEVTVMMGWLQHEKKEVHFSSMAVAALKDKEKGLRGAAILYDNDATAVVAGRSPAGAGGHVSTQKTQNPSFIIPYPFPCPPLSLYHAIFPPSLYHGGKRTQPRQLNGPDPLIYALNKYKDKKGSRG
eukprot:363996-Chlamydomonas_euryale.AAC.3